MYINNLRNGTSLTIQSEFIKFQLDIKYMSNNKLKWISCLRINISGSLEFYYQVNSNTIEHIRM